MLKYSKTATEVEKKVTTFWKNIHLEKFQPYGKFGWTCLLPVPANVLLGHGRVQQEVCIFKEGWDGGGAAAL